MPDDGDVLDWGVLVPLSFLRVRRIVSLSIVSAYGEHRALGQLVRRCAEELGRDTLFLASGDLSHAPHARRAGAATTRAASCSTTRS